MVHYTTRFVYMVVLCLHNDCIYGKRKSLCSKDLEGAGRPRRRKPLPHKDLRRRLE